MPQCLYWFIKFLFSIGEIFYFCPYSRSSKFNKELYNIHGTSMPSSERRAVRKRYSKNQ
jgi:hypothetical protein